MPFIRHRLRQAVPTGAVLALCLSLLPGHPARGQGAPPKTGGATTLPATFQTYRIRAELDPEAHAVDGKLQLEFQNTTNVPLPALWLHLYQNAFRDEHSVFMRDSQGQLRRDRAEGEGRIEVSALSVDGADLLAQSNFEVVDGDRSQLRVPLAAPLPPGGRATLKATFRTELPPAFARSGHAGDFHAVTQWFPKLAKLDPERGFRSFPYHAVGEFYADFARYELTLLAPREYVVGATGKQVGEQQRGSRKEWRFEADAVHDAAWVAAPDLRDRPFTHGSVRGRLLYPPGYDSAADHHLRTTLAGLKHFGERFGEYPYPSLTVVVPPRGASGASGMEYPTLFLTAGFWTEHPDVPLGTYVTAHELAHQWFQGLLASDEVRWPMLDEGLAEWATLDLLRAQYGPKWSTLPGIGVDTMELMRLRGANAAVPPPGRPAFGYARHQYGASVYRRTALVLESLRRTHGATRFDRALGRYTRNFRFKHPTPDDLFETFDSVYGRDFSARYLEPALMHGERASVRLTHVRSHEEGKRTRTEIRARRDGSLPAPTWLALYDEDGETLARLAWPAGEPTMHVTVMSDEKPARVSIDPDRALLLDDSARDQNRALSPGRPKGALVARWIGWLQALLAWVGA